MSFYMHSAGAGLDIVFIHGWGMNSEVWFEIAEDMQKDFRVTLLDLPGHGRSRDYASTFALEDLLQLLAETLPATSIIVGWSLGGMLAQGFAAKYPERVNKLVLVASNAQFQKSEQWPCAMKAEVLQGFVNSLQQDYKATLQQFLMLQALGAENAKQTIRELKQRLFKYGDPDKEILQAGMSLLKNTSLLHELDKIRCPVLLINGRLDGLVPVEAGLKMKELLPAASLVIIDKAAHAPFISHPDTFIKSIREFLN